MKRAQIAIELFFQIAVFFLVLTWFSNYASSLHDSSALAFTQEKAVATAIVNVANQACASSVKITYTPPCIPNQNTTYVYEAYNYSPDSRILRVRIPETGYFVDVQAACNVTGYATLACGEQVCLTNKAGLASIKNGDC